MLGGSGGEMIETIAWGILGSVVMGLVGLYAAVTGPKGTAITKRDKVIYLVIYVLALAGMWGSIL